jgi:hypothetical protein
LLTFLPEEIGRLTKLKVLNLSSNLLKNLPYSICKLKELQAIWLSENQVMTIWEHHWIYDQFMVFFLTACFVFFLNNFTADKNSDTATARKREEWQTLFDVLPFASRTNNQK